MAHDRTAHAQSNAVRTPAETSRRRAPHAIAAYPHALQARELPLARHDRDPAAAAAAATAAGDAPSPYRWVVLLGVWLIYATFGMATVSLAPLVGPITRELGIGHGSMGLIFGAWQLVYIFAAVPCGSLLDRIGVRRALLLAALLIAASSGFRGLASDYVTLFLAAAILGLGGPLISTGAPKMVQGWFHGQERGFAMGIYITGPAVGSIAALALSNSVLLAAFGGRWQWVLFVWAAAALASGLVWAWISSQPAARSAEAIASGYKRPPQRQVIRQLLALPAVRILLGMSVGIFTINHGLNNWLPALLQAKGMTAASAGYWAVIPTIVGLAGSLLIPRLATPSRRHLMLAGLCAASMLATVLLLAESGPLLILGLALQGIARSSMMTVAMLTLVETPGIGERHAATASGLFFSAAEIGGAGGPLLVGLIHDASDGFGTSLAILTAIAAALVLATLRLRQVSFTGQAGKVTAAER